MSSELFDAVDALLSAAVTLPPPAERARLRAAHGLTQQQVAEALRVRRATVVAWEAGRSEPRPPQREAYARLLEKLAALHPATPDPAAEDAPPEPAEAVQEAPTAPAEATSDPSPPIPAAAPQAPRQAPPRAARSTPATAPAETPEAAPAYGNGPLVVLDADGTAYGVGGLLLDCPARTLPQLVDWALSAQLGSERLHRSGKDGDPLVVLTAGAAERLGLPPVLEDRRGLRLPETHPVVKQLARAKWQLTKRGFGPWPRIYRPAEDGRRRCVQLAVLPWGALDTRAWGAAADLPPAELARLLGDYATRVITPRGSAAVSGLELMTALRPPTRAVKDDATGQWVSGPLPGSLTAAVDPAPPEAPDDHPLAQGRPAGAALDEEAYDWIRNPELLTGAECAQPYAVGLDVNTAFLAAANRLTVGTGPAVHVDRPQFDRKMPGAWLVDLSALDLDPRLPSPFTPTGERPTGPAWYATPTVAYAAELGHQVQPLEAWIRPEHGAYLDPWYTRLRDAYLTTMANLGVTPDMDAAEFLDAMATHKKTDPGQAAVLSAIKATVKGGIGKLRERPQGMNWRPGERWPALDRPTWRPDIRAAVISTARVNMHRKMMKLAATGLFPLAILSDCVIYPSAGPSPLDLLPRTPDGKPLPGAFRLGVNPGMVKCEGTQPFTWAAEMLEAGHNAARHIKGTDSAPDGE
ncbi:telomere-associated protein Tap [Streptomyces gibsoniae]|uniref:Helix-turn-helix domain-containing protein n=1 Tax=Streptomyces gibsoniae TaxID=3075529 RepID=A0ABU2U8W9_9ACTN|nr:helix-turn-helix domain-containing protein [Streptomyces sp. DSM 41699]MDT0469673.1 helix-turn-helix domain-containing protein [Streptomyces sp. DSM 41699]